MLCKKKSVLDKLFVYYIQYFTLLDLANTTHVTKAPVLVCTAVAQAILL